MKVILHGIIIKLARLYYLCWDRMSVGRGLVSQESVVKKCESYYFVSTSQWGLLEHDFRSYVIETSILKSSSEVKDSGSLRVIQKARIIVDIF